MTGAELIPVGLAVSRGWRFSSWDRMCVPAPFAAVCLAWGEPVEGEALQEGMERARALARRGLVTPKEQGRVVETSR